ncbi:MAG: hypothetical protein Q7J05_01615 [Paludibacter sp.]|nr:hypothetical protein [Paludibacter sp.]
MKHPRDDIYELIQNLSFRLNRHNPESEVSKLDREARYAFVPVSRELFDVAFHSLNGKTSGADSIELVKDYHAVRFSDPDIQIDRGYSQRVCR